MAERRRLVTAPPTSSHSGSKDYGRILLPATRSPSRLVCSDKEARNSKDNVVVFEAYEKITVERKQGICWVTLNRPERLNAADDDMVREIDQAMFEFDRDDSQHVAIIRGAGRAFCSGADVHQRQLRPLDEMRKLGGPGGGIRTSFWNESVNFKPIISAVHGYAIGLGFGLALRADIVVAAEGTQFQNRETQRGISGAGGWAVTKFWCGDRFANEISLTSRMFSAEEALQHGLINFVVPRDELEFKAEAVALQIMENPPLSVRATVRPSRFFLDRLSQETAFYLRGTKLHMTEDFRESALAFIEKRKPEFKGQ